MLDSFPLHPATGCYVIKLHRDAAPHDGRLSGSVEHIVSGDHATFTTPAALLEWLMQHAATQRPTPSTEPSP